MAGEITYDHGETAPGIEAATNTIPDGPQGGQHTGVDPSISDSVQTENSATGDELDRARGDGDKTKDASEKLDDNEHHNKRNMSDIGTDLSSDKGGRGGGPSMLGGGAPQGGGSAPQQAPAGGTPPSMPPMSPPSMPSGGASPAGMMSMPKDMMQGLLSNYNPDKANASTKDAAAVSDGKGVNADKIDPNSVEFKKTGIGPLTGSQLNATIEKALDLNGIPKDPSVRKQWHEVLGFMAAHESSRNPDAINTHDSNAHGAPAADGHPFNCSRGIWQCIPTTFAAHHVSGTSANIYDPVASCAASINYSMSRYHIDPHGGSSLQAFYASRMKGGYTGY